MEQQQAATAAEEGGGKKTANIAQLQLVRKEKSNGEKETETPSIGRIGTRRTRVRKYLKTRRIILETLSDGQPHSLRDFARFLGLKRAHEGLSRSWKSGLILRTRSPLIEHESVSHGNLGFTTHARLYHLYLGRPERNDNLRNQKEEGGNLKINGLDFVPFSAEFLDRRGCKQWGKTARKSKSQRIWNFLSSNSQKAWFSRELRDALNQEGKASKEEEEIKDHDIMNTARRYQRKGMVYVRGYSVDEDSKPFARGFLLAVMDESLPRAQAIEKGIELTNQALENSGSSIPLIQRIQRLRDIVEESRVLGGAVSASKARRLLGATDEEFEDALERGMQLYPEIRIEKIFNNRYLYHGSIEEDKLAAATEMKKNYIRIVQGKANRLGHNWEGAVEWFVERFTPNVKFRTQNHRNVMDPRRITVHLIKSVGKRRLNAELDRIWTVDNGPFSQEITYVLECKWGLVRRENLDDILEVLKWSQEFGADTEDRGRQLRQGVVVMFAASRFNPKETVTTHGTQIPLEQYAARMSMKLLKAVDMNKRLRERGVEKNVTVQKVCRIARNESEVRELLRGIWENSGQARQILVEAQTRNSDTYIKEDELEQEDEEEIIEEEVRERSTPAAESTPLSTNGHSDPRTAPVSPSKSPA